LFNSKIIGRKLGFNTPLKQTIFNIDIYKHLRNQPRKRPEGIEFLSLRGRVRNLTAELFIDCEGVRRLLHLYTAFNANFCS